MLFTLTACQQNQEKELRENVNNTNILVQQMDIFQENVKIVFTEPTYAFEDIQSSSKLMNENIDKYLLTYKDAEVSEEMKPLKEELINTSNLMKTIIEDFLGILIDAKNEDAFTEEEEQTFINKFVELENNVDLFMIHTQSLSKHQKEFAESFNISSVKF